jgi:hypothetical protein
MANMFDLNKQVATAHVRSEQIKGWFLANAKLILILLSGCFLFLGIVMVASPNINIQAIQSDWFQLLPIIPIALVAGVFAIAIEGGTLFSASIVKESFAKITAELNVLNKVAHKFTVAEVKEKKSKIKKQKWIPLIIMVVCVSFSIAGAEIFWQKVLASQNEFFHIIGYLLGMVCSSLLILFEMREEVVQRIIEKSISSDGLIQIALDQSAKSAIHNELFNSRRKHIKSPEFVRVIDVSAKNGLFAVLSEALQMAGYTVTRQQLENQVNEEIEARTTANEFIANSGETPENIPPLQLREPNEPTPIKGRNTKQRVAVQNAIKKYGASRMKQDINKYATELNMNPRTLERWLNTIPA